ncbi:isochorismate synthase [Oceanobacillus saliphilus]|uniref:isochorismate synthase n=1 Tax=Oceanobacillus saliphilus TaxID=2925834 RepID=UPI00201D9B63|nr:isochorismate synthase [Oceanobacillus saliphilus]
MIEIKEAQLASILSEAIQQLKAEDECRLVSITKKIEKTDPLYFFNAAKHIGNRSFWTSSDHLLLLAGAGMAHQMTSDQLRIEATQKQWDTLLREAFVYNPYGVPGTGLVAVGGMSFDPKKKPTELWEKYKPSHFTIPEFLLTKYDDSYYFTINIYVKKNDHAKQLADELEQMERRLLLPTDSTADDLIMTGCLEVAPQQWKKSVQKATEEIGRGKVEKIVLAREVRLKYNRKADITAVLSGLLKTQPNSYIFAYEIEEDCFVGATPERLVKIEGKQLLSTCLAGTAPRGSTKEEDVKLRDELLHDEKNLKEHDFVVTMIKQAIKDCCIQVNIPDKPVIYPLKNLQHLYTPVRGLLKNGYSIFDIVEKLHPTPALGGTPREESLSFIREHELLDRGWYGAPIGWVDSNKNGEFAVAIRSALIQGDEASLFAGCGVVKDSDPESEYEETKIKLLPMLSVLGGKNK